jgi:hypothetical protein
VAELDDSSTASFREVSALLARQLPGLDRRRFRHRRDLLIQLVIGALAARGNAEASGEPGLMLAPAGPDRQDPRHPRPGRGPVVTYTGLRMPMRGQRTST